MDTGSSGGDRRRPVRRLAWEERPDGGIDVLRPKFGPGRIGRWLSGRMKRPHLKIRLDRTGSFVWRRCDGRHSVLEIGRALDGAHDEIDRGASERLALFLDQLAARGLISFDPPEGRT